MKNLLFSKNIKEDLTRLYSILNLNAETLKTVEMSSLLRILSLVGWRGWEKPDKPILRKNKFEKSHYIWKAN